MLTVTSGYFCWPFFLLGKTSIMNINFRTIFFFLSIGIGIKEKKKKKEFLLGHRFNPWPSFSCNCGSDLIPDPQSSTCHWAAKKIKKVQV